MRSLQYGTLALFGLCALLTAFFQFRIGMKGGQAQREASEDARQAGERYGRLARICAIAAAVSLLACMALGAINR